MGHIIIANFDNLLIYYTLIFFIHIQTEDDT